MCPSCHVYDRLTVCSCLTTLAMHKLDSNGPAQPTQCPSCEECVVLENTIHSKNYNLEIIKYQVAPNMPVDSSLIVLFGLPYLAARG